MNTGPRLRTAALILATGILAPTGNAADATAILWSSSNGSAWLSGTNWTGGAFPTGTQTAEFGVNPTSGATGVGINMNTVGFVQQVGALYVDSNRGAALTIGNSSSTASATGTLQLNGVTVNGVDNVIIRNNSNRLLTLQNTQGGGTRTMDVALGNATDNIVNIDGTGGITISSVIKDGAGSKFSLGGAGSGVLTLSGSNTYTGDTNVSGGTLKVDTGGALANTSKVTVNAGGTLLLSGSGDQINNSGGATFALAGGKLQAGATGLDETFGALTLSENSTIDFGSFASVTFRFAVSPEAGWNLSKTLSIWNWSPTTDRLYFGTDNTGLSSAQLARISFYSDSGVNLSTGFAGAGFNGTPFFGSAGEVSPVPEPSSVAVGLALFGLAGWRERRRSQARRRAERFG